MRGVERDRKHPWRARGRRLRKSTGKFFARVIGIFAALLLLALIANGEAPFFVIVGTALLPGAWVLFARRHDPFHVAASLSVQGYLAVAGWACWLIHTGGSESTWPLVAVAATVVLVFRTVAQELYILRHKHTETSVGVRVIARVDFEDVVRVRAPFVFRWLHRGFALWWVWEELAQFYGGGTESDRFAAYWVLLIGFGCILAGPFSIGVLVIGNVFSLIFLTSASGVVPWMISNFAWFMWSAWRTPDDQRRNSTHAFRQAGDGAPWVSWG